MLLYTTDGNNEKLSRIFGIELLATKTNSKSGEDVHSMKMEIYAKLKFA